jgi:hypothetical protein
MVLTNPSDTLPKLLVVSSAASHKLICVFGLKGAKNRRAMDFGRNSRCLGYQSMSSVWQRLTLSSHRFRAAAIPEACPALGKNW